MPPLSPSSVRQTLETRPYSSYLDPALGIYNYNARFYSTTLGRFLSVDPIGGSPGAPQSWNPYTYALNNPLAYTDPTGMFPGEGVAKAVSDAATGAADCVGSPVECGKEVVGAVADFGASAYDTVTSAGGRWDSIAGGLDMGINGAKACWNNDICQGAVVTAGVIG